MKYLFALLLFAALWFTTTPSESSELIDGDAPHVAYVIHFLQLYPKRLEKALEVMPTVEAYSYQYGFDPLVPAVVIARESAWKTSAHNPSRNEVGLMQVHGRCAKGYDLSKADGQIEAGIACLAMARDACDGSLKQTLTAYLSGHCRARTARTARVVEIRMKIIAEWRGWCGHEDADNL